MPLNRMNALAACDIFLLCVSVARVQVWLLFKGLLALLFSLLYVMGDED